MNKIVLSLLMYMCIGCGIEEQLPINPNSDYDKPKYTMQDHNPVFDKYAEGFPGNTGQIPMVFIDGESTRAGACFDWDDGHREVEINKEVWADYGESKRRWLIWHELGHCELGLDHVNKHIDDDGKTCTEEDNDDNYPCSDYTMMSIMRWYMPHSHEIDDMCAVEGIGYLSRTYCDSIGFWEMLLLKVQI